MMDKAESRRLPPRTMAPKTPCFVLAIAALLVATIVPARTGHAEEWRPTVTLSVDRTYGPPPHTVQLNAVISGRPLDFRTVDILPWYEDRENTTQIEDEGRTLHIVGNAGKRIDVDYQVTTHTVLEFSFRCDHQGEIHGIGFDNDTNLDFETAQRIFVVHGLEGWGAANNVYRHYRPTEDGWMKYRIPVGRYYQGRFRSLVIMNDHDVDRPTADSRFRDIAIYEADAKNEHTVRWDFGDNETASGGTTQSHTYRRAGQFHPSVRVTDADGRVFEDRIAVRVKTPPQRRRNLFINDDHIAQMSGATRVVHRALKHPANPVIVGDKPWDAYRPQVYGTVLHDKARDRLRLWYLSIPSHILSPDPEPIVGGFKRIGHTTLVGYAESTDGVKWIKPSLGRLDFNGSSSNGLVNMGRDNTEGVSIVHDPHDPNPRRRYKAIYWEHKVKPKGEPLGRDVLTKDPRGDGMWVSFSEDGLEWQDYEKNPVIPMGSDTGQCVLFDPALKQYVLFSRLGVGRRISRCTSTDFIKWSKPELVFAADDGDPPGTQVYGSGFCIYEGLYIGTPWMFYLGTDQRIDVQLIHSRDGITWHRTKGRERILPNGPEGAWDSGIIFTASHPLVQDERILLMYSAFQGDHFGHPQRDWEESKKYYRGGIGIATLRRDGWVSLNLAFTGGNVLSKRITIPQSTDDDDRPRLMFNTNAFTGDVSVTLLDEQGQAIPGFERSNNIHGDFLRTEVTWPQDRSLAELVGRPVQLHIQGRLAKLYSFWFE